MKIEHISQTGKANLNHQTPIFIKATSRETGNGRGNIVNPPDFIIQYGPTHQLQPLAGTSQTTTVPIKCLFRSADRIHNA